MCLTIFHFHLFLFHHYAYILGLTNQIKTKKLNYYRDLAEVKRFVHRHVLFVVASFDRHISELFFKLAVDLSLSRPLVTAADIHIPKKLWILSTTM